MSEAGEYNPKAWLFDRAREYAIECGGQPKPNTPLATHIAWFERNAKAEAWEEAAKVCDRRDNKELADILRAEANNLRNTNARVAEQADAVDSKSTGT